MKRILLFIFVISVLLQNCNCGGRLCYSPTPVVQFRGMDSAMLNTVIVKEYNKDGKFTAPWYTMVYTSKVFTNTDMPGPDTIHMDSIGIMLDLNNDFTIEVPAISRIWYFKNISVIPSKMNEPCINGWQYVLNDTVHAVPVKLSSPPDTSVIWLQ